MKEHSIIVVDDHALIRKGMRMMIDCMSGFKVIGEASNGLEFMEMAKNRALKPDIVLLDIDMPKMNGEETAIWITQNLPQAHIIVLSMF